MKQSIHISGMTCNICLAKVTKSLYSIQGIKDLKIDLESGNVQMEVSNKLPLNQIAEVLLPKYKPSFIDLTKKKTSVTIPSEIKELFPLFLIFTYLIVGSILLQKDNFSIPSLMFNFMGLFFIVFSFFGYSEIYSMFEQFLQIAINMDRMHGMEYPQPFLSIGDGDHGTRATKALIFLLLLGFITTTIVFLKNNYFKINEKFLLIIFYGYSIISFKNALGRSDGPHIMLSSDWISILLCFYFLHLMHIFLQIL